nr:SulP family inorganic anion transporter [Ensifer sp. ENS09]
MFGLVAAIDGLGTSVAFAALLFSGSLASGFGAGVSVMLLSCVILAIYVSLRSRFSTSVAQVQETSIAILASTVAVATSSMSAAGPQEKVATAFAVLAVSTLATGSVFYLSGRFRLGTLVRFLPYPVVAGFLAGSGWLLIEGALVMIRPGADPVSLIQSLYDFAALGMLFPSIAFAIALAAALRLTPSPFAAPIVTLAAIMLFYGALGLTGLSIEAARASGWLPAIANSGGLSLPSPIWVISAADWWAVISIAPMLVSLPLVAMTGMLLNTSGLEAAVGRDIDANAELRVTGQANVVVGFISGASGFTGLGMTLLARRLGVTDRSAGLATAAIMALALPFATDLAASIPLFVAAGLMIMLGAELLYDWAIAVRKTLPGLEWAVVLSIVGSMMAFSFMAGMAVGLAASLATFVYTYARLPVIRLAASGRDRRSRTDRSPATNRILDEKGDLIHILELHNYLFFGTMGQVVDAVKERLDASPPPRFLILDFRRIGGTDSAAVAGFARIFSLLAAEGVSVTLSSLPPSVRAMLDPVLQSDCHAGRVAFACDLDHALEDCEEQLIKAECGEHSDNDVAAQLVKALGPHPRLAALISSMERFERKVGERLIAAGEQADDIFLLGRGVVRVQITLPDGQALRLRNMASGAVLGEIAFYLGETRTADVLIEKEAVLFRLTRKALRSMETNDPELAVLAHRLFARALADRLTVANRMVTVANA